MRVGKIGIALASAVAAVALAGCVRDAQIAVPSDLRAGSERIEVTGIGGFQRGTFRLGASQGSFRRSAGQEAFDDGYVSNAGSASFNVDGPELGGPLSADCGFQQGEIDAGIAILPADRFTFHCGFHRGSEASKGELILRAVPRSPGRLLSGISRAGELNFEGRRIGIRAIHDMEGGKLPSGTPLGYMFDIGGRQIGAVDLNGGDKIVYAPPPGPEREAVLAASLALSILWDPGE